MIIRSIHIDRFGGLSDFDLALDAGVNVLFGPNESGKSSAAGFIKFIFYGLPAREKQVNPEKSRALSRETGSAGGWLTMTDSAGVPWRIERSVVPGEHGGLHERIRTVNGKTGECEEGGCPGERFFGVSEEVFSSSCFVRQAAVRPESRTGQGRSPDGMRTAVENLLTSADESVDLERAEKKLDALRRELEAKNGGGEIPALAEKRAALSAEKNSAAARNAEALSLSASLDDIRRRITALEADKARCDGLFDCLEKIAVKRRIDAADDTESRLKKVEASLLASAPSGLLFESGDPAETLAEAERAIRTYDEERIAFRERFPGERDIPEEPRPIPFAGDTEEIVPDSEDPFVEPYEDTGALAMASQLNTDGADEGMPDPGKVIATVKRRASLAKFEFALGVFSAALAVAGLVSGFYIFLKNGKIDPALPFLAATVVLILVAVASVICHVVNSVKLNALLDEWHAESADEIEIAVEERLNALARQNAGKKERKRLSASLESAKVRRNDAVARIGKMADQAGISPREDPYETLRLLRQALARQSAATRQLEERRAELSGRLSVLREQLEDVNISEAELAAKDALNSVSGREAAALSQEDIRKLVQQRDFTESALRSAELRRASLEEKLSEAGKPGRTPDELTTLIEAADERLKELSLRRDALDMAREALSAASESLRQGVLPKIAESASRRLERVSGKWDRVLLDGRLSPSLARGEDGDVSPDSILSRGTADLLWLSLRLALSLEMFRGEIPPVILDESFAHIDGERTSRFIADLVREAEAGLQILILTCRRDEADAAREAGLSVKTMPGVHAP